MELDPRLPIAMGIAAAFDIILPIVLVLFLRKRFGTKWVVFGLGAIAFGVSQLLLRLPIVVLTQNVFKDALKDPTIGLVFVLVLALTAGLFEETARYLCYSKGLKSESNWKNAVSLGAGHGGLESALFVGGLMIVGLINAVVIFNLDLGTAKLSAEQIGQVQAARETILKVDWWGPLLGAWERVSALAIHLALSVIVLQAYVRKKFGWYWLAVGYHTLTNAVAVLVMKQFGGVAAELALTVFLALSIWIVFRLRPRDEAMAVPA